MNPNELGKYKNILEKTELDLKEEFSETPDRINFEDRASPEAEADEATAANEQVGIKDELRSHLEEVRMALERIDSGTYGKCEDCGMDIESEVLDAAPESRYCKDHKLKRII